jgi:hypothetical protein
MVGEHECTQQEKLGAMGQWIKSADESLRDIKDEQQRQGLMLTEAAVKLKNVEREVFNGGGRGRGGGLDMSGAMRRWVIPVGAGAAIMEILNWLAQHIGAIGG